MHRTQPASATSHAGSDESIQFRRPTDDERRLIAALLARADGIASPAAWLAKLEVRSLADGGMGSLELKEAGAAWRPRKFGRKAAELSIRDADQVQVIASLNVDSSGEPIELDVWKMDFSPVRSIPPEIR